MINPLEAILARVVEKAHDDFPMVDIKFFSDRYADAIAVELGVDSPVDYYNKKIKISVQQLEIANDVVSLVAVNIFDSIESLIGSIPIEDIGAYPFARIWHDTHTYNEKLLWHPERAVPGWVFPRAYQIYPKDQSANIKRKQPAPVQQVSDNVSFDKMKEVLDVSTNTKKPAAKKRTVKRAPIQGFDPSKVRAPNCPIHHTEMYFDHIEQKWRCNKAGCRQVARPARDDDDKTVVLGKGGLQLRLVAQEGKRSVVLISDDNIALNITSMVDVDEICDAFDVKNQAAAAVKTGKEVISIPTEHNVLLRAKLVVMGTSDLTV